MVTQSNATKRTRLGISRLGIIFVLGGSLLLAAVGTFFGFQTYIGVRYDDVTGTSLLALPKDQELFALLSTPVPITGSSETSNTDDPSIASLYSYTEIAPQDWANPFWAQIVDSVNLYDGYLPLSEVSLPIPGLGPATFVSIPIIGLEIGTIELSAEVFGDGQKYAAPAFELGIIPGQPNPGELGNTWFFGHLESPIRGEGSVFRNLPKVHDFLRQGHLVYVIVNSEDGSFLYQATEFRIMAKEDVTLWGSNGRTATLVASWPRFKYDERVVVTTELVGVKLKNAAAVS